MFRQSYLLSLLILICSSTHAEIVTDGTVGQIIELQAPNYQITQSLGQRVGPNLFHSFEQFTIGTGETATFLGSSTIKNVISRVTGHSASTIDGTLKNTIPNADTYLINPNGIMFGPDAQLDVQGSFYASTADTLTLQDGGEFNARYPENTLLSVAPVESFGFLTEQTESISLTDSQLLIPPKETLALVGGHLTLDNAKLVTPEGQIYLTSVNGKGNVNLNARNQVTAYSDITAKNGTLITTSGKGAGKIDVRANTLALKQSRIRADALKEGQKGHVHIQVNHLDMEGNPNGRLNQEKVVFDTVISSATISEGDGGDIYIEALDSIILKNATIFANSGQLEIIHETGETKVNGKVETSGRAGNITVNTQHLHLDNASIESNAFDEGQGGNIVLNVSGKTELNNSYLAVNAFESTSSQANRVGEISLTTSDLKLRATVLSSTTSGEGKGGNVTLYVNGPIWLDHSAISVDANTRNPSAARPPPEDSSLTPPPAPPGGDAGHIYIQANTVTLTNRSNISSNASGSSQGGQITIYATKAITLQNPEKSDVIENPKLSQARFGIQAISLSKQENGGHAGEIWLETPDLTLSEEADINTSSLGGGDAGHIHLIVDKLIMKGETKIISSNSGSGNAGDIVLKAGARIRLQESQLTTEAKLAQGGNIFLTIGEAAILEGSQITTSVQGGSGDGGDITLQTPEFFVLNCGQIKAQAYQGNGGNIYIAGEHFATSSESIISASSQLGVDGNIVIDSPEESLHEGLLALPANFIDSSHLLRQPCSKLRNSERSRLIVKSIAGSPLSPDDLRNSAFVAH